MKIIFEFKAKNNKYSFFEEGIGFGDQFVRYQDLFSYSYLLTINTYRYGFIPFNNSVGFTIRAGTAEDSRKVNFYKTSNCPFFFHTKQQAQTREDFIKMAAILDSHAKPLILKNLISNFKNDRVLKIGNNIELNKDGAALKRRGKVRSSIKLSDIASVEINNGRAIIRDHRGKAWCYESLLNQNAPLLPDIVSYLRSVPS